MEMLPAMREGLTEPTPAPEAYAVRQIVIYAEDGKREITRAQIDADGHYRATLPVGIYVADINHGRMEEKYGLRRLRGNKSCKLVLDSAATRSGARTAIGWSIRRTREIGTLQHGW